MGQRSKGIKVTIGEVERVKILVQFCAGSTLGEFCGLAGTEKLEELTIYVFAVSRAAVQDGSFAFIIVLTRSCCRRLRVADAAPSSQPALSLATTSSPP